MRTNGSSAGAAVGFDELTCTGERYCLKAPRGLSSDERRYSIDPTALRRRFERSGCVQFRVTMSAPSS